MQTVIHRTPMRARVWGVSLHCNTCATAIPSKQKFALWTYLTRTNRCGTCKHLLWTRIPWIELVFATTFGALAAYFGFAWDLPAYLVAFAALIAITIVDIRHYIIPNRILYPALFLDIALFAVAAIALDDASAFLSALIGMGGAGLFFFIVWFVYPKGMGFGDVRLALLIGLITGWVSLANVFLGVFLGVFSGAAVGVLFVLMRFLTHRDPIPYGPFLALGGVVSVLWGDTLVNWMG